MIEDITENQLENVFEELQNRITKAAAQVQVGKTKLFTNYIPNPTSACATGTGKHSGPSPI